MLEYYFLWAVMFGAFDPSSDSGWQHIARYEFADSSLAVCLAERDSIVRHYRDEPILGGGVVITNCQQRRKP